MSRGHKPIYVEEHNFLRPPVDFSTLHDNSTPISFQIIGMDETNSETTQWDVEKRFDDKIRPNYWGYYVRLSGVDEEGHSVTCFVNGFKPFVYVQVPATWDDSEMRNAIMFGACPVARENNLRFSERDVASIEKTSRVQFYGFTNFEQIPMFKINFNNAKSREKFIQLCDTDRTWGNYRNLRHEFWLWDACVPPLVQFSNVHNIMASMWVLIKPGKYKYRDSPASRGNIFLKPFERRSRAQLDIDCNVDAVFCDTEKTGIAKLLILCEDIEVAGEKGLFPEPDKAEYPVIQIAATVQRFGDPANKYVSQCCFCLRETENLRPDDVKIYWFDQEAHMLEAYYRYWTDCVDPDIRVAFNQYGFDGPYLYNRYLKFLMHMIPKQVLNGTASFFDKGALDYGKYRNLRSSLEEKNTASRAHGGSKKFIIEAPGRVEIDVMVYAREEWKLIVGLNELAAEVLGDEQKDDIHFSQITPMFNGDSHTRGRLAKYCVRDTELPLMILEKRCVIIEQIEKSRLTGVTLHTMFNRKQTVRVETLLFRETHRSDEKYAIPQEPFRFIKDKHLLALFRGEHGKEGALVLPATANFYTQPICTLDFSGLYPSIIRAFFLCYTTIIFDLKYLATTEYRKDVVRNKILGAAPYEIYWAKLPNGKKPLLYRVLTNILNARDAAKKTMKKYAKTSVEYSIFNARQLALKVVANATYGYTVIEHDKCTLPCAAIGITVTHYGREMIMRTREEVHKRVPGSEVIYGDTDSVMIKFSNDSSVAAFKEAFVIGPRLAKEISALYPPEVALLFEKVFYPYYLVQQKNYAGIIWTSPVDNPSEHINDPTNGIVKISGLASVKSDTIGIVARWTDKIIEMFLRERDSKNAKIYLINELKKFVRQPLETDDVAISIKMSKEIEEYEGNNEVATVAAAIAKRDPGRAPGAGHKVTFVHCLDKKKYNESVPVDVEWYEANRDRYVIDKQHYLHNLMIESVGKLFDLPSIAQDPYYWFVPFETALKAQQNGGGIARFLVTKPRPNVMEIDDSVTEIDVKADGSEVKPNEIEVETNGCAANELTVESLARETCTVDHQEIQIAQPAAIDDDKEFPMHLFKDTAYPKQSLIKKKRLKKTEEKQLKDECRRLSVTIDSVKVDAQKRKLGLPISHFFKMRKIGEDGIIKEKK